MFQSDTDPLFQYVADVIKLPMIQDIFEEIGAIITSGGLIWPIDVDDLSAISSETPTYYHINVIKKVITFLPTLDADDLLTKAVTDLDEIIAVIDDIRTIVSLFAKLESDPDLLNPIVEIRFNDDPSPDIGSSTKTSKYLGPFSLS